MMTVNWSLSTVRRFDALMSATDACCLRPPINLAVWLQREFEGEGPTLASIIRSRWVVAGGGGLGVSSY